MNNLRKIKQRGFIISNPSYELGRKEREAEIIEIIDKWYEDLIKQIKEQKE